MSNAPDLPAFLAVWGSAAQRALQTLPSGVTEAARRSWFDTVAVMAAGVVENCTRSAMRSTANTNGQLTPGDAALVLGTASHALDYDDVCMLATCHPSAPPVAALLAILPLLEQHRPDLTWSDMIGAYVLGTETTLRLGEWLGFRHYGLGFHATNTLGVVGVAASVAHVLRLPLKQAHAALAIAASHAGGLRANFGTDTKPLHVGFAAAAGIRSALLAQAGASASDDVWGPSGFFHAFSGGDAMTALPWTALSPWALARPGFEHKRFPSCYLTHRLIAGIVAIRHRQVGYAGKPVHIAIEVPLNGLSALKYPHPATGLEAKFSGPYCAATAWIDGAAQLPSFNDAAVKRPALQAQMRNVVVRERSQTGESLDSAPVHVTVRGEGWSDSIVVDWAPGSPADPMTRDQLRSKWHECASHAGLSTDDSSIFGLLDAPLDTRVADLLLPLRKLLLTAISKETT
jgi:2-methylcitrate dehydratase PrpD